MIKLTQMTQFMHNHIIGQMWWQQRYAIIKIQAALLTATPPPGFLVFNADAADFKTVKRIKICQPAFCQCQRPIFMGNIFFFLCFSRPADDPPFPPHYFEFKHTCSLTKNRLLGDSFSMILGSPHYLLSELYRIYPLVKMSMGKLSELAFLNSNHSTNY